MDNPVNIGAQTEFAVAILRLKDLVPFSVTSWGRTQIHNAALPGAVGNSQHLNWLAVDIVFDTEFSKIKAIAAAKIIGLECIDENTHVHIMAKRV